MSERAVVFVVDDDPSMRRSRILLSFAGTRTAIAATLICCLACTLFVARPAHALDPNKRLTQYLHTSWRIQDGVRAGRHVHGGADFRRLPLVLGLFPGDLQIRRSPVSSPALSVQGRLQQQSIQGLWRSRRWAVGSGQPRDRLHQRRGGRVRRPIGRLFVVPERERGSRRVAVGRAGGREYLGLGSLPRRRWQGQVFRKGRGSTDQPDRFDTGRRQGRVLARRPDGTRALA